MKHEKMDFNIISFYLVHKNKISRKNTSKKFPIEAVDPGHSGNCCFTWLENYPKKWFSCYLFSSLANLLATCFLWGLFVGIFQKNAIISVVVFALIHWFNFFSRYVTGEHLCWSLLLTQLHCNVIKNRLKHRCFLTWNFRNL